VQIARVAYLNLCNLHDRPRGGAAPETFGLRRACLRGMSKTTELLNQLQADATVFYQKARSFHWTVAGERFFQLHEQFEAIYTRWAGYIDDIAERTVIDGGTPLLSLASIASRARIQDASGIPDARGMIEAVVSDLRRLLEVLSQGVEAAESEGNRGAVNLLEGIREEEEKALWMLSASLQ
jgi:starvation-inducible DNA-binding protein